MSSSTEDFSCSDVQEEGTSLIPCGAGYAAPPPTPSASCPPPHGSLRSRLPLHSKSATNSDGDEDQFLVPFTSCNTTSPPSKQDLDALAQYLLQQSLYSTPNLPLPSLQRKRRTPASHVAAVVVHPNKKEDDHVICSRNEQIVQAFSYAGGFGEESKRGIVKACQEAGAFHVLLQDGAEEALSVLKGRHGVDGDSIVEGGLITVSQLLSSASPCHLQDHLDLDSSGTDTIDRDIMTTFTSLLSRVSQDTLRILLEDLPIAILANIRDQTLKPLLHIYGNGTKLNYEDDVVLFISHNINICKSEVSTSCLARSGVRLQTWSQGKYKASLMKTLCDESIGEICIQLALVHHD